MAELTHESAEDGFHEIQLSGKQVGFLFMLTSSVLILVFLLGIQVGRGVRAERGEEPIDATPAANTTPAESNQASAPSDAPAPVAEGELSYSKRLDENPPAETLKSKPAEPVVPEPTPPPSSTATAPPAAAGAAATPPSTPPATTSTPPAASRAAVNVPTAGRSGRWVVQVITLSNRAGAAEITQRLISKGYPAFLLMPSGGAPTLYRVQIGRYADRGEADRVARRLAREEDFKPEVKR